MSDKRETMDLKTLERLKRFFTDFDWFYFMDSKTFLVVSRRFCLTSVTLWIFERLH